MNVCVRKLTIISADNGLSPGQCQAFIWTSAGILLIRPLETNLGEILIEIQTFSLKKILLKISSEECCPFFTQHIEVGTKWLQFHWWDFQINFVLNEIIASWLKFHSTLFIIVQVTISCHCFRLWFGSKQSRRNIYCIYIYIYICIYMNMYSYLGLNDLIIHGLIINIHVRKLGNFWFR